MGKVGVVLVAMAMLLSAVTAMAADDFKKFGVRVRGIYIMPDESTNLPLKVEVEDAVTPELDFEYFLCKNFSAELVLALSKHDVSVADDTLRGHVWLLPPSFFVKYHMMPGKMVSPYLGFGFNVVMPFDEKLQGVSDFKVDSTIGYAAKIGADIKITESCYLNVDAMYYNTEPKMQVAGGRFKLDLNPIIIGTGIGVRF